LNDLGSIIHFFDPQLSHIIDCKWLRFSLWLFGSPTHLHERGTGLLLRSSRHVILIPADGRADSRFKRLMCSPVFGLSSSRRITGRRVTVLGDDSRLSALCYRKVAQINRVALVHDLVERH
jgi:hypothetical protein